MFSLHSSTCLLSPLSQPFLLSRIAKCAILRGAERRVLNGKIAAVYHVGALDGLIAGLGASKMAGVVCRCYPGLFAALRGS